MTQAEMLAAIAGGEHGFDGKDMLIGTTADEMQAHYAADHSMIDLAPDAVVARFGGEAKLPNIAHAVLERPLWTCWPISAPRRPMRGRRRVWPTLSRSVAVTHIGIFSIGPRRLRA